jgi:hypothetical protein
VSRFPGTGRSSGSRTAGRAASSPQINGATFPRPLRVGTLTQTSGAAGSGRSWSPGRTASGVSRRRAPGRTPWGPADGAGAGTVDISDGGAVIEHRLQSADD